ncbi:MAG: membrane protein insertase YidC, partial [Deltaproteobacteria bacterium]|nr:membrane protein insertase YidC [Deltaproteobacteria bacterium]
MEKRVVLAFALSIIVFVAWNYLYNPTPVTPPQPETAADTAGLDAGEKAAPIGGADRPVSASAPEEKKAQTRPEDRIITVETDLYTAVFTESGGRLLNFTLKKYRSAAAKDSPPQELVNTQHNGDLPLGTYLLSNSIPGLSKAHFSADVPEGETRVRIDSRSHTGRLTFTNKTPEGFEVVKTYNFIQDSYLIDLKITLTNRTDRTVEDNLVLELVNEPFMKKKRYSFAGLGVLADKELLQIKTDEIEEKLTELGNRKYSLIWAGYEDQYFLTAAMPKGKDRTRIRAERYLEQGIRTHFISPFVSLGPKTQKTYTYTLYFGPKDYKLLKSLNNGLERSIYFGWFDILSKPLLVSMVWIQQFVKNYGLTIIILTVIIKLIFWPLTAKSHKSMREMQKIQPRIKKLREKYKNDRQAMNREMMQMYRTFKI